MAGNKSDTFLFFFPSRIKWRIIIIFFGLQREFWRPLSASQDGAGLIRRPITKWKRRPAVHSFRGWEIRIVPTTPKERIKPGGGRGLKRFFKNFLSFSFFRSLLSKKKRNGAIFDDVFRRRPFFWLRRKSEKKGNKNGAARRRTKKCGRTRKRVGKNGPTHNGGRGSAHFLFSPLISIFESLHTHTRGHTLKKKQERKEYENEPLDNTDAPGMLISFGSSFPVKGTPDRCDRGQRAWPGRPPHQRKRGKKEPSTTVVLPARGRRNTTPIVER